MKTLIHPKRITHRLLRSVCLCTLAIPTLGISTGFAAPVQNAPSGPLPPNLQSLQITPSRIATNQKTLITATLNIPYAVKPASVTIPATTQPPPWRFFTMTAYKVTMSRVTASTPPKPPYCATAPARFILMRRPALRTAATSKP